MMDVKADVCMHVCAKASEDVRRLPQLLFTLIFKSPSLNLESADLPRLAGKQRSVCLCIPSTGVTGAGHYAQIYFYWGSRDQTQVSGAGPASSFPTATSASIYSDFKDPTSPGEGEKKIPLRKWPGDKYPPN